MSRTGIKLEDPYLVLAEHSTDTFFLYFSPSSFSIMADKEATVYIVDVGRCMKEKNNGRDQSDLDWAMTYVWEKITSTVGENESPLLRSNG